MKKVQQSAKKEVIVIARIQWKHENKVCYLVRASAPLRDGEYTLKPHGIVEYKGKTLQSVARDGERYLVYQVCFLNGKIAGCQCPSMVTCYHKTQLIALEQSRQDRTPVISLPVLTPEADVIDKELEELLAVVEAQHAAHGLKKLPGAFQIVTKNLTTGRPTDISTMGTLNGNRAFSLLK